MLSRVRTHLTYANVMATTAMCIALGGTSYAATKIGSNQIANNAVQSRHIKDGTITARDVKRRSLTAGLFRAGQIPRGPAGATGAAGATGPQGPAGAAAATAFAAVSEGGQLSFGKGVTSVSAAGARYTVRFDRSLTKCALLATQGFGSPFAGGTASTYTKIQVTASVFGGDVLVSTNDPSTGADKPASFFLAVLC